MTGQAYAADRSKAMPRSLDQGPSAIVPVKAPNALRERLRAVLAQGETLSDLTRKLWERECEKRERQQGDDRG
jgi:hypothetical protein